MQRAFRIAIYGLLRDGDRFLMTHSDTPNGPIWNFPGGALEWGEDPAAALEREFAEETGLAVRISKLLFTSRSFHINPHFPSQQSYHTYYAVERVGGDLTHAGNGADVLALAWYSRGNVPSGEMLKSDLEFVSFLQELNFDAEP